MRHREESDDDTRTTIRELIAESAVAMLTTRDEHGRLVSRPMLPLLIDDDARVHFLTHGTSAKVAQIARDAHVSLTLTGPSARCVALCGHALVTREAGLITQLWQPGYRAWFPDGASDADAVVLSLEVDHADLWDASGSRMTRLIRAARAVIQQRPVENARKTVDGL